MSVMDERELFTEDFERHGPDEVWAALKRGLATWDLKEADDETRTARFDTSDWTWSWGNHLLAEVAGGTAGGSRLIVRGRPKARFMTTNWGEDKHAGKIEKELLDSVRSTLGDEERG